MLFRKNIEPSCSYCIHGNQIDSTSVMCIKKGVVPLSGECSRFKYDPLKRTPPAPAVLSTDVSEDDFIL